MCLKLFHYYSKEREREKDWIFIIKKWVIKRQDSTMHRVLKYPGIPNFFIFCRKFRLNYLFPGELILILITYDL